MVEKQRRSRNRPLPSHGGRSKTARDWHQRTELLVISRAQLLVARDHGRTTEASDTIKVEITRGLLRKGHQVLFMSKDDTGGARSRTRRSGTLGDSRRILESFKILEAECTREVVTKTRHLKWLDAYKNKLQWRHQRAH